MMCMATGFSRSWHPPEGTVMGRVQSLPARHTRWESPFRRFPTGGMLGPVVLFGTDGGTRECEDPTSQGLPAA